MNRWVLAVFHFFSQHRRALFACLFGSVALFICALFALQWNEDIASFLPQTKENERINYANQHVGASNKIVIRVASAHSHADHDLINGAIETLANHLATDDSAHHIQDMTYFADPQKVWTVARFMAQNMPLYVQESDYLRMDSLLDLNYMREQLRANKALLLSPLGAVTKETMAADPFSFTLQSLQQLSELQIVGTYQIIDGFVYNQSGTEGMLILSSAHPGSETEQNKLLVQDIANACNKTTQEFDNQVIIDYIGAPVIAITNASRIKKDSLISTILATLLILTILLLFFRKKRLLLTLIFPIAFGALFALAFLALFRGEVSVIAIAAGSIMVGIAVNYPLHYLAHLQQGFGKEQTINDVVNPLVTGNITTVGAFLSLLFISSSAMRDLGLFAAMLLVGTILFVLIFLPHLVDTKVFAKSFAQNKLQFSRFAHFNPEKNRFIVAAVVVLTIPLYFLSKNPVFETNMLKINYMTERQQDQLAQLMKETDSGNVLLYGVAEGETMEQALVAYEAAQPLWDTLQASNQIIRKSGVGNLLLSKELQKEKIERWNVFWEEKRADFLHNLEMVAQEEGFHNQAFAPFVTAISHDFQPQEWTHFEPIVQNFANSYLSAEAGRALVYTLLETTPEQSSLVAERVNQQSENLFAFSSTSLIQSMVSTLSADFDYVLYICAFLVFAFLTISFGRLELSLLSFLPLAVGWIWILGLMNLFDIRFNIVNIILATFIFGQGDDYTIFVTEGLMHEYAYRKKMLASYKNSILLSSCLMFIGIGTLIVAQHPALKSLAAVTIIGMFVVVMMAFVLPPLVYRWLTTKRGQPRRVPITLWQLLITAWVYLFFILGLLFMTISGLCFMGLCKRTARRRLLFHKIIRNVFATAAYAMPGVPCRVVNPQAENFEKPSLIIANHQSFFDLVYTLMLTPKLLVLTNNRVANSWLLGAFCRFAEFFPAQNMEAHLPQLQQRVAEGYSVLVFPEGTRSLDSSLGRFHQGAFYLAEKWQLDIVPVLLHGVGGIVPKKEWLFQKGQVTVKILPRIPYQSATVGADTDLRQRARTLRQYYQSEYEKLVSEMETPAYFENLVRKNYIYKGREVERRARQVLKQRKKMADFIQKLPETGYVLIKNCGQGEWALMAALVRKKLQITATDPNECNLLLAQNCASVPANLTYQSSVVDETIFDVVVDNVL